MLATIFYRAGEKKKKINILIQDETKENKRRKEARKLFKERVPESEKNIIKYEFKW